mmetsp:Transcript_14115/g.31317  ORF Transcript_14115/g.31317 Transcript_14115/m.31317 type:complete len:229 (+) Transcript_14115:901-1587(+)
MQSRCFDTVYRPLHLLMVAARGNAKWSSRIFFLNPPSVANSRIPCRRPVNVALTSNKPPGSVTTLVTPPTEVLDLMPIRWLPKSRRFLVVRPKVSDDSRGTSFTSVTLLVLRKGAVLSCAARIASRWGETSPSQTRCCTLSQFSSSTVSFSRGSIRTVNAEFSFTDSSPCLSPRFENDPMTWPLGLITEIPLSEASKRDAPSRLPLSCNEPTPHSFTVPSNGFFGASS